MNIFILTFHKYDKAFASDLYLIYNRSPAARVCKSDTDRLLMLYLVHKNGCNVTTGKQTICMLYQIRCLLLFFNLDTYKRKLPLQQQSRSITLFAHLCSNPLISFPNRSAPSTNIISNVAFIIIIIQTNLSLYSARLLKAFAIAPPVVLCGCTSDFHLSFECTEELENGLRKVVIQGWAGFPP